jgi:hypothetical protein
MLSKGREEIQQRYRTRSTVVEITEEIDEAWKQGFDATELVYGDGNWVVLLSKGGEDLQQRYRTRSTVVEITADIDEAWREGFDVTELIYGKEGRN